MSQIGVQIAFSGCDNRIMCKLGKAINERRKWISFENRMVINELERRIQEWFG